MPTTTKTKREETTNSQQQIIDDYDNDVDDNKQKNRFFKTYVHNSEFLKKFIKSVSIRNKNTAT